MEQTTLSAGSIIVGVDGSSDSDRALDWAVGQATLAHRPLAILHATDVLGPGQAAWLDGALLDPSLMTEALEASGRLVLAKAASRARQLAPDLVVHEVCSQADPRNALLAVAADASMIVIGSRGRGPVASLLLGSVSVAVSKHAACPVVVIRPQVADVTREGVLVGVDGTALDRQVVEFAFRLASQRTLPLTVIHSFWDADHLGRDELVVADDEAGLDDKRRLLDNAVHEMAEKFADVRFRLELVRGFTDRRLIERSQTMDAVVVGSRRSAQHWDLGIGSLAPTVVEHAQCTVAVVPVVVSR